MKNGNAHRYLSEETYKKTRLPTERAVSLIPNAYTDKGDIICDEVVLAVGPWVRQLWLMLGLPDSIGVRANGAVHETPMWRYWSLQEGTLIQYIF